MSDEMVKEAGKVEALTSIGAVNERQKKVAWSIASGRSWAETGRRLGVAIGTINTWMATEKMKALVGYYKGEQEVELQKEWAVREALDRYRQVESEQIQHKWFCTLCQLKQWLSESVSVSVEGKVKDELAGKSTAEIMEFIKKNHGVELEELLKQA